MANYPYSHLFSPPAIKSLWYNEIFKKGAGNRSIKASWKTLISMKRFLVYRWNLPPAGARVPGARYLSNRNLNTTLPIQTSQGADSEGTVEPHDRPGPGPVPTCAPCFVAHFSFIYSSSAGGRLGGLAPNTMKTMKTMKTMNSMNKRTTYQEA